MQSDSSITVSFDNQSVEIGYNNLVSRALLDFLFKDLSQNSDGLPKTRFDIIAAGKQPMLSLWKGDKRFYFGQSRYRLAYILVNEVIYHCITENRTHHAIHAGAVRYGTNSIILPGNSGSGKSTLTAWLITHGFQYLTDELILLSDKGRIIPFTRPISFKDEQIVLSLFPQTLKTNMEQIVSDENGAMIPHRLLNPDFSQTKSTVTHVIFPEFQKGAQTDLYEISPAKSCMMLLKSHVNARNLSGLGISRLSRLVKHCQSFKLIYGGFEGLDKILPPLLSGKNSE